MGEAKIRGRCRERGVGVVAEMHLIGRLFVVIACLAWPVAAVSQIQIDDLRGGWQQVESNSGRCPTCLISIMKAMDGFSITANNGWTASIKPQPDRDGVTATGRGQWIVRRPTTVEQKTFECRFVLRGDRLYMTMTILNENGSRQIVKAVFERPAYGA